MIINDSKVDSIVKENGKVKNKVKRMLLSFLFGGIVGVISYLIYFMYDQFLNVGQQISLTLTSGTIVLISFILTCLGIFDKLVNIAYSGILIPISGFANSITSSALEGKSEGLIFGIGSKIFSLIGSVCTYGIVSSIFFGFIYFVYKVIVNA